MNALKANLTADYGEEAFDALAIPTNNFGLQEPGANSEIMNGLRYVRPGGDFVPTYKVAAKNEANGVQEMDVFTWLKGLCFATADLIGEPSGMYWSPVRQHDLTWNFEKFLIDQEGKPVKRFSPSERVDNMYEDIVALLQANKQQKEVPSENTINKHPIRAPHLNMKQIYKNRLGHP